MRNWILILFIILTACETPVHPNLPEEDAGTVVYSFFRPGIPVRIDVFNTVPILESVSMNRVSGLTIELYEDDRLVESITENAFGAYIGTTIPKQGSEYRFVTMTSEGLLSANNTVPQAIEIEKAIFTPAIQDISLGEYGYPVSITFADPGDESNYYELEVFVDDCDDGCEDTGISGELNELLVEDVKVNTSGNTEVTIAEGPEGIDGVRYLYLSDNGFNGQVFTFNFFLIPTLLDPEEPSDAAIKFVLKSITEEYYQYLLTSDYQEKIEEEAIFAEPVQVYTNIQNGLGVFAGYDVSVYEIRIEE